MTVNRYRPPVPLFVPALSVVMVLSVLFYFGVQEQTKLADAAVEQQLNEREHIAQLVSEGIEIDLQQTMESIQRFSRDLEVQLHAPDSNAEKDFESLFELLPDGSTRSRRAQFDPITEAGVWIPNYTVIDPGLREFFVRAKRVTEMYGRGAYRRTFADTWILPASSGIVIFWPEERDFVFQATADFDYRDTEWVTPTQPLHNPNRHPYWTKLSFDPTPKIWMMSAVAPFYWRGQWFGAVGHDMPLNKLIERTDLLRQHEGSQFVLLTADKMVAASDHYAEAIKTANGELPLSAIDPVWAAIVAKAQEQNIDSQQHVRVSHGGHIAFVSKIRGQNWWLINLLPLKPITTRIENSFNNLRNIALASLLLELLIATALLAWNHHRSNQFFAQSHDLQQQLITSEELYRSLVADVPGVVFRCRPGPPWTMEFISSSIFDISGYPASEFLADSTRSFASILHPDDCDRDVDMIMQSLKSRRAYATEYRVIRSDGHVRWLYEHARGVYDHDLLVAIQGVILDTTPLKEAEHQLQHMNATLEEQVELRTRELKTAVHDLESFNYAVSHDLKAPLRHLSGYLEMIREELQQQTIQPLLDRCDAAIKRMHELIAGLLALSQLGRESLSPVRVDLATLIGEYLGTLPPETKTRLRIDVGPMPTVIADRVLMRQVIQNLVDNAIKYSSKREQPLLTIRECPASNNEYVIEFRDNGVGFDLQQADKLFMLFQRMHRQEEFPGTGVGLALCAKILQLHNGRIWANAAIGQGASFFIALPIK